MEKLMSDKNPDNRSKVGPLQNCQVPGFELCKVEDIPTFLGLEKFYGTSSLYNNTIPCDESWFTAWNNKDTKDRPGIIPEYLDSVNEKGVPHPDGELYDHLPESLFRGIKILGRAKDPERQKELILQWKTKLFSEKAAEVLCSPTGIDFIIRLSNDRQVRVEAWEENRDMPSPEGVSYSPRPGPVISDDQLAGEEKDDKTYLINRVALRKFLMEDKWIDISPTVKKYQDELTIIVKRLREEGKKCVGCALNPYLAQLGQKLGQDFQDSSSISEVEISDIKKELGVSVIKIIDTTSGTHNHVTR